MTRCYIGGQSCSNLVEDNPKRSSMMCFFSTIKANEKALAFDDGFSCHQPPAKVTTWVLV